MGILKRDEYVELLVREHGASREEANSIADYLDAQSAACDRLECPECSQRMTRALDAFGRVGGDNDVWVSYRCTSIFCKFILDRLEPSSVMGYAAESEEWDAIRVQFIAEGKTPCALDVTLEQRRRMLSRRQRPMTNDEVYAEMKVTSPAQTDASPTN